MSKTFNEWEKQTGFFAIDEKQFKDKKSLTDAEFKELVQANRHKFTGVNYEDRVKFLKDNDYEVNRENLINPDLSARS